jgi:hypothetical protein
MPCWRKREGQEGGKEERINAVSASQMDFE